MNSSKKGNFLKAIVDDSGTDDTERGSQAKQVFVDDSEMGRWLRTCRKLDQAGYGASVTGAYERYSPPLARRVGTDCAIALADVVSSVAIKAGRRAAECLPAAAIKAAERLEGKEARFRSWMGLIERFAGLAPESVEAVLLKMDILLSRLNVSRLEAWLLAGVRATGIDHERRLSFFTFEDVEASRWLDHESGSVVYSDLDRELKAYLTALWGIHIPLREPPAHAPEQARRRASFSQGLIRIPPSFPGYRGEQAADLYRAALAHVGAHMMFSGDRFPIGKLKPVQVALVSLIEDARVELLAIREFPGLRRLWLPFHVAQATGSKTAPSLMARLSRALLDSDFDDEDGWIRRAHTMFYDRCGEWECPAISREIGGLIGNDLGQMRVQFNARTYVVEPPYRDDNLGLWDFGDEETPEVLEAEQLFDSIRIEEQDDDDTPPDQEREEHEKIEDEGANQVNMEFLKQDGIPVARYPEYDYVTASSRPDWTTIVEFASPAGYAHIIDDILERHAYVVNRIKVLIDSARVSRPQRINRQQEGEYLDLNACIEAVISRRMGENPDPHVYSHAERRHRDLSVHVLLDVSESTKDKVVGSDNTVLELERQATALLAHALFSIGDPFAIAAFSSNRREEVRYYRIKDFGAPYNARSKSCLAGLSSGFSTRIGAAMRHAAADLKRQQTHRKLLLVITDGEPSDIDVSDRRYLVEDARHVIHDLAHDGIDVFCVGLDSGGDSYLTRIFGRRNVVQIDRLESLPERLPMLYFRLTA
ncbi:nitric oxide reductase activation protein NorD [Pelagibius sp.]|uniref:nitric oxide reductase activation protein NorD n=1 Tax=Pelagibius sp. TaxID=1931238 RepID=UPI003BB05B6B